MLCVSQVWLQGVSEQKQTSSAGADCRVVGSWCKFKSTWLTQFVRWDASCRAGTFGRFMQGCLTDPTPQTANPGGVFASLLCLQPHVLFACTVLCTQHVSITPCHAPPLTWYTHLPPLLAASAATPRQALEPNYEALAADLAGSHVRVAKLNADGDNKEWAKANLGLTTYPTIVMLPKAKSGFVKYPSERRDVDTLGMWVKTLAGSA